MITLHFLLLLAAALIVFGMVLATGLTVFLLLACVIDELRDKKPRRLE